MTNLLLLLAIILILLYAVKVILYQKIITSLHKWDLSFASSKESWPKSFDLEALDRGPGFGLPLKEAVLLKDVQVKSV